MGIAGATALATAVWLFLVARNVARPTPLPMAATVIAVCLLILGCVVWDHERSYREIARYGVAVSAPLR